jgi:2-dehydro-3-deoxygluconokinase
MEKRVITLGEVMMRLSAPGCSRFTQATTLEVVYGGAEANVAVSLACLGIPAAHVTRLPENDLGKAACQSLQKMGVHIGHIHYGSERMGLYFLENGAMQRPPRIVYDRFDSAFAHIKPGTIDWEAIMKEASWFHWTGITPAISLGAAEVCMEALVAAEKYKVPVSGDINYRRNLWQYGKKVTDIMPALIERCDYLVAGLTDFENCLGWKSSSFEEACQKATDTLMKVKKVAFTYRESISASHNNLQGVIWDGNKFLESRNYALTHIVDRVGGGDAFMAGLIYGWISGHDDAFTVEFATAASALKHSIPGDVNTSTLEEVLQLVKGENTGKLLR